MVQWRKLGNFSFGERGCADDTVALKIWIRLQDACPGPIEMSKSPTAFALRESKIQGTRC